ncbi:MAG: hypothetical protein PHP86_06730, partial [Nevskiales bacterium]|nr:hypothetical protein [Nevskiales bacterium]
RPCALYSETGSITPARTKLHGPVWPSYRRSDSTVMVCSEHTSPDRKVDLISVSDPALARQFQAVIANRENSIAYCYCSIFDDCWLADSRQQALQPESVEACPDFGEASFRN